MFKRITTSLSRPSQTVFFMKDSWKRVTTYILLLPFLLIVPMIIFHFADPSMSLARYNLMIQAVEQDLRVDGAIITDGVLTYTTPAKATFDYFSIYVGSQQLDNTSIAFVFEQNDLVMYLSNIEFDRESYANLNLLNHDFSSQNTEDLKSIDIALKVFFEQQPAIVWTDIFSNYLFRLMDYIFIVLVMSLMMLLFVTRIQFPFKARFKLSVYLTTIWVFSEFVLILFHAQQLEFISVLLAYIYHIITYRSMKIIKRGVIQ